MTREHNRFERGSGRFACRSCGKQTRNTGDNGSCGLCPLCYEKSGCSNTLSDEGYEGDAWKVFENCQTVQECYDLLDAELAKLKH
jgi:hypothetical protein